MCVDWDCCSPTPPARAPNPAAVEHVTPPIQIPVPEYRDGVVIRFGSRNPEKKGYDYKY
jgi:hypothetical protein